jgi:hypothetical protein
MAYKSKYTYIDINPFCLSVTYGRSEVSSTNNTDHLQQVEDYDYQEFVLFISNWKPYPKSEPTSFSFLLLYIKQKQIPIL